MRAFPAGRPTASASPTSTVSAPSPGATCGACPPRGAAQPRSRAGSGATGIRSGPPTVAICISCPDEASGRPLADPEPITTPATSLAHLSIAADGRHIAYSSVLVTTNVQRLAFDPVRGTVVGEPTWLTHGSRRWANPAPSPDGQYVAFYSLVEPEGHVYVMRADGVGSPRQLTGDTASDRLPRWSPDGNWIAVFSNRSGPLQIWKIHPDGSGLTQLTDAPTNMAYPVWAPSGTLMAAA
ncbi:MAG: hypothetical protein E6J90_52555, partial [Deltaproteobacteria bacterium]